MLSQAGWCLELLLLPCVLKFLSHRVAPPAMHIERGWIPMTRTPEGDFFDWREVTGRPPPDSIVRISFRSSRPAPKPFGPILTLPADR